MSDQQTIEIYSKEAQRYADLRLPETDEEWLIKFSNQLPEGGTILDLGCGPGWASLWLKNKGFSLFAIDPAQEMVRIASEKIGNTVRVGTAQDIDEVDAYDGIWAGWCLHHVDRDALPSVLTKLHTALKSDGLLFVSVKGGNGQARDSLDRLYVYYQRDELEALLTGNGQFEIIDYEESSGPGWDGTITPFHILIARKRN